MRAKAAMQKDKDRVEASTNNKRKPRKSSSAAKMEDTKMAARFSSKVEDEEEVVPPSTRAAAKPSPSTQAAPSKRRRIQNKQHDGNNDDDDDDDVEVIDVDAADEPSGGAVAAKKEAKPMDERTRRRQQMQEARARARQWGAKQQQQQQKGKAASATSSSSGDSKTVATATTRRTRASATPSRRRSSRVAVAAAASDMKVDATNSDDDEGKEEGHPSTVATPAPSTPAAAAAAASVATEAATAPTTNQNPSTSTNVATPGQPPSRVVITSPQFVSPMQAPVQVVQSTPQYQVVPRANAPTVFQGTFVMGTDGVLVPANQQQFTAYQGVQQQMQSQPQPPQPQVQQPPLSVQQQHQHMMMTPATPSATSQAAAANPLSNAMQQAMVNIANGGSGAMVPPPQPSKNVTNSAGSDSPDIPLPPTTGLARTASAALRELPRSTGNMLEDDDDDDDDDDIIPPPPVMELEKQISQQVMANCAAALKGQPLPFTDAPELAFSSDNNAANVQPDEYDDIDEEPIVVDNVHSNSADYGGKNGGSTMMAWYYRYPLLTTLFVAVIIIIIIATAAGSVFLLSNSSMNPGSTGVSDKPCFLDSYASDEEGYVASCSEGGNGVACPSGGMCEGGKLVACFSSNFEVSETGVGCLPTKSTNDTIDVIRTILEEWTIRDQCSPTPSETLPVFPYSDLQVFKPDVLGEWTLERGLLDEDFVIEYFDDGAFVGLPETHGIQYPLACRVNKSAKEAFEVIGSGLISATISLVQLSYIAIKAYPLVSLIGLLAVLFMRRKQEQSRKRSLILQAVAQARQLSYERLMDDPSQSHIVLHIRDEIAMELHPNSKKDRHRMNREVWPRVVSDVHADNRVRKCTKILEGKQRDVWQWIAAPSKNRGLKMD